MLTFNLTFHQSDRIDSMLAGYLAKLKRSPEELAALMQPIKRITQGLYVIGNLKVYMKVTIIHLTY